MYFFDEKRKKIVLNCPSCSAIFIEGKGANCLDNCPAKQLENKHKKVIYQIINFCFPSREIKVKVNFILDKSIIIIDKRILWGWTYCHIGEINITWYTLRSKKNFLHCIAHEVGHITDYERKFTAEERKIIQSFFWMIIRYKKSFEKEEAERLLLEMKLYEKEHQLLLNKLKEFKSKLKLHNRERWYQEYLENHQKIINSPWQEYAYGNFDPLPYDFFTSRENWG